MTVDTSKLKVGDFVHVRMRVVEIGEHVLNVEDIEFGERIDVGRSHIVHVEPQPLKAGDIVTHNGSGYQDFKILHIYDGWAWCDMAGVSRIDGRPGKLLAVYDLTRVEE